MSNNVTNLDPLTTLNASSSVYQTSKINQRNQQLKAEELTLLIQKLLSVGTFESIGEAVQAGIKRGTFVVIDNPNTPKREFKVVLIN
jgi:hypothetical protein